jgi:hypothetical protein
MGSRGIGPTVGAVLLVAIGVVVATMAAVAVLGTDTAGLRFGVHNEIRLYPVENNDSPADLRYVDDVGGSNTFESVYDDNGDRIPGDKKRGVTT